MCKFDEPAWLSLFENRNAHACAPGTRGRMLRTSGTNTYTSPPAHMRTYRATTRACTYISAHRTHLRRAAPACASVRGLSCVRCADVRPSPALSLFHTLSMYVCMYVCVHVRERDRGVD